MIREAAPGWRRRAPATTLLAAAAAFLLATSPVLAAVGWTSPVASGRAYSWNFGFGLARTVTSTGVAYLHTQAATDYVGGSFVVDDGPTHVGIYYRRGTGTGQTWAASKRMNPSSQHAYQGAIAAAGTHVYVAWSTVTHIGDAYMPSDPRTLWFRSNDAHGSATHWASSRALTTTGRIDHPTIAAAGSRVYIAHTDGDNGNIVLWSSTDYGATFTSSVIAVTDRQNGENGFAGWPIVVASGTTVAVGWLTGDDPQAMISTDSGMTFAPQVSLAAGPAFSMGMAAKGDRVAVAVSSEAGSWIRLWKAGTWKPVRGIASHDPSGTTAYKGAYAPAVALAGTSTVAVAWSATRRYACPNSRAFAVDLKWRESTDNTATLKPTVTVASCTAGTTRRINDYPSVLMTSPTRRLITYNTASSSYRTYRVFVEVGTGTP